MTVGHHGACGGDRDSEWEVVLQLRREVEQKRCHIARLRADAQLLQRTDPDCLHAGEERALRIAAAQVQLRERGETLVSQSERLRYLKGKLLDARNRTRRQLDIKLSAGCGLQAHHGSWPDSQSKTSAGQERRLAELEETSSEHAQYLTEAQRELEARCEEVRMRQSQEGRILELEGFLAEQEAALCDARDEATDRAEELQALQRSIGLSVGSSSSRVEELREELAEMNMSYEGVMEMRALRDAMSVEEQAVVSKDLLIADLEERVGLSISEGSVEMHLVSSRHRMSGPISEGANEGAILASSGSHGPSRKALSRSVLHAQDPEGRGLVPGSPGASFQVDLKAPLFTCKSPIGLGTSVDLKTRAPSPPQGSFAVHGCLRRSLSPTVGCREIEGPVRTSMQLASPRRFPKEMQSPLTARSSSGNSSVACVAGRTTAVQRSSGVQRRQSLQASAGGGSSVVHCAGSYGARSRSTSERGSKLAGLSGSLRNSVSVSMWPDRAMSNVHVGPSADGVLTSPRLWR
mmetsp:Transcript_45041/g.119454  ORF Transcript_45041/g.119454 Transcript_45041/m.119454 type:complete len:520 (-) Transcript_45041:42-1601(-)